MFQLSLEETQTISRSQIVTLKQGHNIKYLPYAFTEQSVAMLSGLLRSEVAVRVNTEIMRAFVRMREIVTTNTVILRKVEALERKVEGQDVELKKIFETIRELLNPVSIKKRNIGIRSDD